MATQEQRRAEMRARLIKAAREVFLENSFDEASTEAVLAKAGASKGALYHHFDSKQDLFAAVFAAVSAEAIARAGAKARTSKALPEARFTEACFQWLKAVETGEARAILIDLGPRVLGFARARDIEDANSLAAMRAAAFAMGAPSSSKTDVSIRLLNAALGELALLRARDGLPKDAEARRLILALIRALFRHDELQAP